MRYKDVCGCKSVKGHYQKVGLRIDQINEKYLQGLTMRKSVKKAEMFLFNPPYPVKKVPQKPCRKILYLAFKNRKSKNH